MTLNDEAAPQVQLSPAERLGDVDGDGALDLVIASPKTTGPSGIGFDVRAISLRDGRLLWTYPLGIQPGPVHQPELAVDLTGDGRDEILFTRDRLRVWGPDLKELWSWRDEVGQVNQIVPGSARQPAMLLLDQPMLALSGADGHARWAGQTPTSGRSQFRPEFLDPGDPTHQPLL